jgi:hypothetical protein
MSAPIHREALRFLIAGAVNTATTYAVYLALLSWLHHTRAYTVPTSPELHWRTSATCGSRTIRWPSWRRGVVDAASAEVDEARVVDVSRERFVEQDALALEQRRARAGGIRHARCEYASVRNPLPEVIKSARHQSVADGRRHERI